MALLRRRGSDEEPPAAAPAAYQAEAAAPVQPAPVAPAPLAAPYPFEQPPVFESGSRFQLVEGSEEMLDMPLGTINFRAGLIAPQQLEDALAEGLRTGKRLGEVLLARGWLSEEDLTRLLAGQKGLPFAIPAEIVIDQELARRLSYDDARREMALPLIVELGLPVVAMADPTEDAMDRVRLLLGEDVRFVVSPPTALARAIDQVLGGAPAPIVQLESEASTPAGETPPPGLAPIADMEPSVIPVAQSAGEPGLTSIAPQGFEEITPLIASGEIDYPSFDGYETLPEAELLSGPSEQLPLEQQGGGTEYFDESYQVAESAPDPGTQPYPEDVNGQLESEPQLEAAYPAAAWLPNGAPTEPLELAEEPAVYPVEPAYEPELVGAAGDRESPDVLASFEALEGPESAEVAPETEPPAAAAPAWARGEVSANAAELLSGMPAMAEEEAVMDDPFRAGTGAEPTEPGAEAPEAVPFAPEGQTFAVPEPPYAEPEPAQDAVPYALEAEPAPAFEPSTEVPAAVEPAPFAPPAEMAAEDDFPRPALEAPTEAQPAFPEPAEIGPEPTAVLQGEPEPEPAVEAVPTADVPVTGISFEVLLRMSEGERLVIDSLPTSEQAQARAQEVIMQIGSSEPGKWPFIAGRFLRPDTILSVDIEQQSHWVGSGQRSRMFQD
ncbi:MAG: GspE/PulE/PilB domain-containing protein [Gaiellaceae bacterium]